VTELSNRFNLVVVTSRQHIIEEATIKWVQQHYPGIFQAVLFGNHWGKSGEKRTKLEMCQLIKAVALIDDALQYVEETADVLPTVILFGNYAWNFPAHSLNPKIKRADTWSDVLAIINKT